MFNIHLISALDYKMHQNYHQHQQRRERSQSIVKWHIILETQVLDDSIFHPSCYIIKKKKKNKPKTTLFCKSRGFKLSDDSVRDEILVKDKPIYAYVS